METSSLQNFADVCGMPEQMKQDFAETRTTCNARKSLAWDSAFFTSPGVLEPEELFQAFNSKKCSNSFRILGKEEENLLSSQNLEPENGGESGNFSCRKSLAWDNAFFSEEGVLNPEELSIVNRGFKKHVTHLPPGGINEKLWKSTESSLTTRSERSSLTRLEMDLFEDMRTSVAKRSTSSKICTSSLKLRKGAASNNLDVRSKIKAKAVPSSRRHNTTTCASLRESYFPQPTKLKHAAGSGEYYTPSNLKPPRAERAKTISTPSTRRSHPDGHDIKSNNKTRKAASAQYLNGSKKPCYRDPYNPIFSSMPLLKGCLSASLVDVPESTLWSPQCMSSKSPSVTSRKISNKIKTRDAAGNTFGTPLRNTRAKKMEVENYCEPPLLSTPKSSSSLSPASSMGKWSSQSSASATKSYGSHKASLAKQCGKVLMEIDLDSRPDRQTCSGHGNSRSQHGKKCMTRHDSSFQSSKQVRPSCLRMPSPSIGYFDTENSQFGEIEGESEILSQVDRRRHQPRKLQHQESFTLERSPGMVERESYTSQKATPDISESFSFLDRVLKEEKTISNKEGNKDYSEQMEVKCGNSGYTGQNMALSAKAGGHREIISRKGKRDSKQQNNPQIVGDGNKENVHNFEDPVERLARHVSVLDLSH